MRKYNLHIVERRLAVTRDGHSLAVNGRETNNVVMLFQSMRAAVEAIAWDLGHGDGIQRQICWQVFRDMVDEGACVITLTGEARQMQLAAFYVQHEFGLPRAPEIHVRDDEECIYESLGFRTNLEQYRDVIRRTQVVHEQLSVAVQEPAARDTLDRHLSGTNADLSEDKPLRIGILGQTGAGKSTLINAMLGRNVMPSDTAICTAAVVDVVYVPVPELEGVVPYFRQIPRSDTSLGELERKIAELDATISRLAFERKLVAKLKGPEVPDFLADLVDGDAARIQERQSLESLRHSLVMAQRCEGLDGTCRELSELSKFVSLAEGANSVADMVERVEVRLCIPLLKYVSFVDTPGLRDPNPERSALAMDAIRRLDGWIYAIEADRKANMTCDEDLEAIQTEARNPRGMLVLTKSDKLVVGHDMGFNKALQAVRAHYAKSGHVNSDQEIPAIAAWGPAAVAGLSWGAVDVDALKELIRSKSGFGHLRQHMAPPEEDEDLFRADELQRRLFHALKSQEAPESAQLARDFFVELSGILQVTRQLSSRLEREILQSAIGQQERETQRLIGGIAGLYEHVKGQADSELSLFASATRADAMVAQLEVELDERRQCVRRLLERNRAVLSEDSQRVGEWERIAEEVYHARDRHKAAQHDMLECIRDKLRSAVEHRAEEFLSIGRRWLSETVVAQLRISLSRRLMNFSQYVGYAAENEAKKAWEVERASGRQSALGGAFEAPEARLLFIARKLGDRARSFVKLELLPVLEDAFHADVAAAQELEGAAREQLERAREHHRLVRRHAGSSSQEELEQRVRQVESEQAAVLNLLEWYNRGCRASSVAEVYSV